MKRKTIVVGLTTLLLSAHITHGITLDDSGTGGPPDYYTCTQVKLAKEGAGGKEPFRIQMTGYCAVHSVGGLSGWTAVAWKEVYLTGEYHYSSGTANEIVRYKGQTMFSVSLSCSKNPWAHGAYVNGQTCNKTTEPVNNTGAVVDEPYPKSAMYLDNTTKSAIADAENFQTSEEILGEWNPYEQSTGEPAVIIQQPSNYQVINQNSAYYDFEFESKPGFSDSTLYLFEFERLEKTPELMGDIAIPSDYTHWWQPFWSYSIQAGPVIPLGISGGLFSGQSGKFRVRVRGNTGWPDMDNIGGWTPWRYFCVGEPGSHCSAGQSGQYSQATMKLKSMQSATILMNSAVASTDTDTLRKQKQKLLQKIISESPEEAEPQHGSSKSGNMMKKTEKPRSVESSPGELSKRLGTAPVMNPTLVASRYRGGMLIIHLNNKRFKPSKSEYLLAINHPQSGKTIWESLIPLPEGQKVLKISEDSLNLAGTPQTRSPYHLVIDGKKVGTVSVNPRLKQSLITKPRLKQSLITKPTKLKGSSEGPAATAQQTKKLKKSTLLIAKPELAIKLSMKQTKLSAGETAVIGILLRNKGKVKVAKGIPYELISSGPSPFGRSSGTLSRDLEPGKSMTIKLTTKELEALTYDLKLKTKYGVSNRLSFKVDPKARIQHVRKPSASQQTQPIRVVPSSVQRVE